MAPGQILLELVIPIVSVAATVIGALIVKKRRDRKKAKACNPIDIADDHRVRIEALEHITYTNESASRKYVEAQIQSAVDSLRAEIECVNERPPSKSEMERHVDDGCVNVLHTLRAEMLDTAKKIGEDAESDVEVDMSDVRKVINEKIQEYDLAITKWVNKKLEDYQPTLQGAFAAAQHDVKMVDDDMCDKCDDEVDIRLY